MQLRNVRLKIFKTILCCGFVQSYLLGNYISHQNSICMRLVPGAAEASQKWGWGGGGVSTAKKGHFK